MWFSFNFFALLFTLFMPERPMMYADVGRPTWPQHLLNTFASVISLVLQLFTALLEQKGSHHYPVEYGYLLSENDTHKHCPVCLGIVHSKLALSNPGACVHFWQLHRSTLKRHVAFVELSLGAKPDAALACFLGGHRESV